MVHGIVSLDDGQEYGDGKSRLQIESLAKAGRCESGIEWREWSDGLESRGAGDGVGQVE